MGAEFSKQCRSAKQFARDYQFSPVLRQLSAFLKKEPIPADAVAKCLEAATNRNFYCHMNSIVNCVKDFTMQKAPLKAEHVKGSDRSVVKQDTVAEALSLLQYLIFIQLVLEKSGLPHATNISRVIGSVGDVRQTLQRGIHHLVSLLDTELPPLPPPSVHDIGKTEAPTNPRRIYHSEIVHTFEECLSQIYDILRNKKPLLFQSAKTSEMCLMILEAKEELQVEATQRKETQKIVDGLLLRIKKLK